VATRNRRPECSARKVLTKLSGRTIETYTRRPKVVLAVDPETILVRTERSPKGTPVPIEWVQRADRLGEEGEVEISVSSLGYRSAFVGAVVLSLPGVARGTNPPSARVADRGALDQAQFRR